MPSLEIRNIGPIRDGGEINFASVCAIFGPQSSGKSTILKILAYCSWLEKQLMLPKADSDKTLYDFTHYHHFRSRLCQFFRFDNRTFSHDSFIHYKGDCVEIRLEGLSNASIKLLPGFKEARFNTKLAFIPAERNIVSTIRNYDLLIRANQIDSLVNYILEWQEARENFKSNNALQLAADQDIKYFFNEKEKCEYFRFRNNGSEVSLPLFYASSGIQASAPVDVMVSYIASQVRQEIPLTAAMLGALDKPSSLFPHPDRLKQYQSASFFIEEPEQNLFPASQAASMANLIRTINRLNSDPAKSIDSRICLTTHSPYILNHINLAMKGADAMNLDHDRASGVMSKDDCLDFDNVTAYFISDGRIDSILDDDLHMICGVQLDTASSQELDIESRLDDILYQG